MKTSDMIKSFQFDIDRIQGQANYPHNSELQTECKILTLQVDHLKLIQWQLRAMSVLVILLTLCLGFATG